MSKVVQFGVLLRDLRSVKLPPDKKLFVDRARIVFESTGNVSLNTKMQIRRLCSQYSVQLKELYRARKRARHTNGKLHMGLTKEDVELRVAERKKVVSEFGI